MPVGDPVAAVYRSTRGSPDSGGDSTTAQDTTDLVPTDLRAVGGGTAAIINGASFDAADILAKRVSYRMLRDAGVTERVADALRREYSLVWSFFWTHDPDLCNRAAKITGLTQGERDWIAASAPGPAHDQVAAGHRKRGGVLGAAAEESDADGAAPDRDPDLAGQPTCPRCGVSLSTYMLGSQTTTACESCGFTGLDIH